MKESLPADAGFLPFADLNSRLKRHVRAARKKKRALRQTLSGKAPSPAPQAVRKGNANFSASDPEAERNLFFTAVADVCPLPESRSKVNFRKRADSTRLLCQEEDSGLEALRRLVDDGEGFVIRDTAEYIEGTGYNVDSSMAERLHQGEFSVQAHIDLHGLVVAEARYILEEFLQEALKRDRRSLLVIHGRGLSSPMEPVLKKKVCEWLTRGRWRKLVIAFASARAEDGGAGATYVLLRRRPLAKKFRHKKGVAFARVVEML